MADTVRALSALQTLLANNTTHALSAQDLRDSIYSALGAIPYVAVAVATTADEDDCVIDVTAGAGGVTITLPAVASTRVGKFYIIRNADGGAGNVTVDGDGSETINGVTTKSITSQYEGLLVVNTGAAWAGFVLTLA